MSTTERIERLLDPAYGSELPARSLEELRSMKRECSEVEHAVSYHRRLAQARIEILEAERDRRSRGGSVDELIEALPQILSGSTSRSPAARTRVAAPERPALELRWPGGEEQLVSDDTLANLPALDDEQLAVTLDRLHGFERELSDLRRRLHGVLDGLEREVAARRAAGATG